jgi:hypothetical protein
MRFHDFDCRLLSSGQDGSLPEGLTPLGSRPAAVDPSVRFHDLVLASIDANLPLPTMKFSIGPATKA